MSSHGGKLEIAGTVVGQWAGARHNRDRGACSVQVVSICGPNRGYALEEDESSTLHAFRLLFKLLCNLGLMLSCVVVAEV